MCKQDKYGRFLSLAAVTFRRGFLSCQDSKAVSPPFLLWPCQGHHQLISRHPAMSKIYPNVQTFSKLPMKRSKNDGKVWEYEYKYPRNGYTYFMHKMSKTLRVRKAP